MFLEKLHWKYKKKSFTIKQKQGTHAYYEIDVVFMSEKCHFSIQEWKMS